MSFEIKLPLFKGPFDLLLFFIQRDELDINDIPISKITDDFLDYIHTLEQLDIEVASEFIFVAASLMRIKSRMLLPRPEFDEKGEEIDPRQELIKHLMEYKKYKSVVGQLQEMEERHMEREPRGNLEEEINQMSTEMDFYMDLQDVDLYKLIKAFSNVIRRYETQNKQNVYRIIQYPYSINNQKEKILSMLINKSKLSFIDLFYSTDSNKIIAVYNFLAILELLQMQQIKIIVGEGYNNFWLLNKNESV